MLLIRSIYLLLSHSPTSHTTVPVSYTHLVGDIFIALSIAWVVLYPIYEMGLRLSLIHICLTDAWVKMNNSMYNDGVKLAVRSQQRS